MDKNIFNSVLENFSVELKIPLTRLPVRIKDNIEEIRLRAGCPLSVYSEGRDIFISWDGVPTYDAKDALILDSAAINKTFQILCNYSVYALSDEIRNGFITIKGGHRIGLGGKVIYGDRGIEGIKNLSSINFRIAREKPGISNNIIKFLFSNGEFLNTLIISPPKCGKTTLLRDIIRNLSNGMASEKIRGHNMGVVDERSEIAGMYNGIPQKDVGIRTDILDSCRKSLGIMMMIRAMSPEIIAVDEIGGSDDIAAIEDALRAGIKVLATVHGSGYDDIKNRRNLRELISEGIFHRYIVLDGSNHVGTIKEIRSSKDLRLLYTQLKDKGE